MTFTIKRNILPVLLAVSALPASAQLNNTVEVTNEVKPVVKDANKINVLPSVVETPVKHHQEKYSFTSKPFTAFAQEAVRNYSSMEVIDGDRPAFVSLAGGSHGLVDFKADYRYAMDVNNAVTIDLSLDGFDGKNLRNEHYTALRNKLRKYDSRAHVRYDHWFANNVNFFAQGTCESQVFNYLYDEFATPSVTDKQHATLADFSVGITPWSIGGFCVDAEAGVKFFNHKYKATLDDEYGETIFNLHLTPSYKFSDEHAAEVGIEAFHSSYGMENIDGISHFHFTPHYLYTGKKVSLQLGVVAGTDGDIAPDVKLAYHINPRNDIYVKATGYDLDNDFRHISGITPYFQLRDPDGAYPLSLYPITLDAEFHQLDACLGYRFTASGISGDINVGYDMASNMVSLDNFLTTKDIFYPHLTFTEGRRFYANLDLSYAYSDIVKVDMKNQFNGWKHKYDGEWYDGSDLRPTVDLRWKADVKIIDNLFFGTNFELAYFNSITGRNSSGADYERPTTINLGASLRYTLPLELPLTVFVKGDNLLNHKHDIYYGYRAIGANVMAGFAMSF